MLRRWLRPTENQHRIFPVIHPAFIYRNVQNHTVRFTDQCHSFHMLKAHEAPTKAIAELTMEMNKPRIAASVALTGYACSRCGCQFPESQPPKGRTAVESRRLEKAHTAREFALHVCAERGWPPVKRMA
jgi:hypothetical protein